MKPFYSVLLFVISAFVFVSCGNLMNKEEKLADSDFAPVKINDEYSVKLPDYMKKAESLNDEASLQFQNTFKETYIIVIDEPKEEFITTFIELDQYDSSLSAVENYKLIQMKNLEEAMTRNFVSEPKKLKIHGLDAIQVQMDGNIEAVPNEIAYFLTFIEGRDKLYMMMAWTLRERKEKYSNTFESISKSFRQLGSDQ
jgi:hypothetical protein